MNSPTSTFCSFLLNLELTSYSSNQTESYFLVLQICDILEVTEEELKETSLTPNTHKIEKFVLRERVTHVATEAHRVAWWLKESTIEGLGNLMTASHNSMGKDYDASDPACDR